MNKISKVTIIGFGNQAKVWGANLLDSGVNIIFLIRKESKSVDLLKSFIEKRETNQKANSHGKASYAYLSQDNVIEGQVIAILTPDHTHLQILKTYKFKKSALIIFAHGFSMHVNRNLLKSNETNFYGLLAPKSIAHEMRQNYLSKTPIKAVYSLEFIEHKNLDSNKKLLFSLANNLGIFPEPYESDILSETQSDLFSEQSLLCGLIPFAANLAFKKLRAQGIPSETAYLECWHELKLITSTMVEKGPLEFFKLISPNALYGAYKAKNLLFDEEFSKKFDQLLCGAHPDLFQEEVQHVDFDAVRKEMSDFWKEQELTKEFSRLN